MPGKEGILFRPKPQDQLRKQADLVSARIGYPIVPTALGEEAYSTDPSVLQSRFPNRYGAYRDVWNISQRQEHDVFIATDAVIQDGMAFKAETWCRLAPMVENLNTHLKAHQQGEVKNGQLKERQIDIFSDIRDHIEDGDTEGTIQAPTGFGKTVLFNQLVEAANVPTLIVVPTQELVKQTYERFQQFTPDISVGRVYSDAKEYGRQVTITTYNSLMLDDEGKLIPPEGIKLVILDEAHKGTSKNRVQKMEVIEHFGDAVIIGLSATPVEIQDSRFKDTRVAQMTQKIWHTVTEREAIEEGYLAPFSSIIANVDVDLSDVKITASGHYDENDVNKLLNTEVQNKAAVELFLQLREEDRRQQLVQGKQQSIPFLTSWYSASVAQAKEHAELLQEAGIKAASVWGTSNSKEKKEHAEIMKKWKNGEIEVVCSKDKLVEGLDIPGIRVVFNVAPTASPIIEKQRSGRGLRLDPNNPDKHTLIVDFVYKNSNKRTQQALYAGLIGAAGIVRRDITTQDDDEREDTPSTDISHIQVEGVRVVINPEEVMRIVRQIEKAREESLPIDPKDEVGITQDYLDDTFVGGKHKKQKLISDSVLDIIAREHPEAVRSIIWTNGKPCVVLKIQYEQTYKQLMERRGIKLRREDQENKQSESKDEVAITYDYQKRNFKGGNVKTVPISNEVLDQIDKDHPDAWKIRIVRNGREVKILKKEFEQLYKEMMQAMGIDLQIDTQIDPLQEVKITQEFRKRNFFGTDKNIVPVSTSILNEINVRYPNAYRKVKINGVLVSSLKSEYLALYFEMMQNQGIRIK